MTLATTVCSAYTWREWISSKRPRPWACLMMMVGPGSRCWAVFCVYITITMASPDTGQSGDWTAGKQDETIYWRPLQFYSLQIFSVSENVQIVTPNKCRWEWLGGTNTGARFIFYIHTRLPPPSLCQTAHHKLIGAEHGVVSARGENWSCHYLNYQKNIYAFIWAEE